MLIHRHPVKARAVGWFVAAHDDPAETPAHTRHGKVLLLDDGRMSSAPPLWEIPDDPLFSSDLAF